MTAHRTVRACAVFLTTLVLAPVVAAGSAVKQVQEPAAGPVQERIVRVGEREVRAFCTSPDPKAILLHGGGTTARSWLPVLQRLEGELEACAYDRPGTGASRPDPSPRGWYELMDELRQIHRALGAPSGYVLVGEGLGGLYARLLASGRSGDVRGLLLLDPSHEEMPERARPGMPPEAWAEWMQSRLRPNDDGVVEARLADRARERRLPSIPVTILTATRRQDGNGWDARFLGEAARQLHASILRGVPMGRHLPARGSGPVIQEDRPDLVARELRRLVDVVGASRPRSGGW
ncbi:MAG: alpha/beta hydrolase [Longimicrobiales bacterium]|nr:alpha/beta hydrolase [Longimicrobiales bacterium]